MTWDYEKEVLIRLVIDKHGILQESEICLEVLQEFFSGASRGETVALGNVRLNLAEFVVEGGGSEEGERGSGQGVTRRYLMQASKINSTLKVGLPLRGGKGGGLIYSLNQAQAKLILDWNIHDTKRWRHEFYSVRRFFPPSTIFSNYNECLPA